MNTPEDISNRLKELDELKAKVDKLLELNKIGEEIGDEVRQKFEEYKSLKSKGVEIPFLEKKFADQLYPRKPRKISKARPPTQSEIEESIARAPSAIKAAKLLGIGYQTFKKYAVLYGVHQTKGWLLLGNKRKRAPIDPHCGKYPIEDVLQNKYPNFPIHRLKDKLIRAGIKKPECEQCGFSERRITDGKLPLLLNFEDGNNKNHKLENLRLLCYNCTFTSGKGYISRGPKIFDPDILQDSKKILTQRF